MIYKREEVIKKGKEHLVLKTILFSIGVVAPYLFMGFIFIHGLIAGGKIEDLGVSGWVGLILPFTYFAVTPSMIFLAFLISTIKEFKDPLKVGCVICDDNIDSNQLYQQLQEKETVDYKKTPSSKNRKPLAKRSSRKGRIALTIILTIFYSAIWFSLHFIIVGFFMPTPVRFCKSLSGSRDYSVHHEKTPEDEVDDYLNGKSNLSDMSIEAQDTFFEDYDGD